MARRFVRELRAARPELPAIAEQRSLRAAARTIARGPHARRDDAVGCAGEGVELLRRHRHDDPRAVQDARRDAAAWRRHGTAADRSRGQRRRRGVQREQPIAVRARARRRIESDTPRDQCGHDLARCDVRARGEGTAVPGRDQHRARRRADRDGVGAHGAGAGSVVRGRDRARESQPDRARRRMDVDAQRAERLARAARPDARRSACAWRRPLAALCRDTRR